jgi:hypothetical protein
MRRLAVSPRRAGVLLPRLSRGVLSAPSGHPFGDGELPRGVAAPSPADVAAHHAHLERLGTAQRAKELQRLQTMSAEVGREQDTLYTFSRTMAHALLVRPVLFSGDVVNPATLWGVSYDDVGGPDGAMTFASASALAPEKAFPLAEMAAAVAAEEAAGGGGGGGVADASPPIGGALSHVPAGALLPTSGEPSADFAPNPVALLYVDALTAFLEGEVLPRVRRRAAEAPAALAAAAAATGLPPAELDALLVALLTPGAPLPAGGEAALRAPLPPPAAAALSRALAAARDGGPAASAARCEALQRAAQVLAHARAGTLGAPSGGPRALPTARVLHDALAGAAALASAPAPLRAFATQFSAAADAARDVVDRLCCGGAALNRFVAHALRMRRVTEDMARGGSGGGGGGGGQGDLVAGEHTDAYALDAPPVAEVALRAGFEVEQVLLREIPTGRSFNLALGPRGGQHSARLDAGHVPAMLSPLMHLLTPTEWAVALTTTRAALPSLSAFLLRPVALRVGASAGGAGAAAAVDAADVEVAGGEFAVSVRGADGGTVLNPTGVPNSVLNAVVPALAGGGARGESAPAPAAGADARARLLAVAASAPSAASREEYLRYVLRANASGELLRLSRALEAGAAGAAGAGAGGDAPLAAARAGNMLAALRAGEVAGSAAGALRALKNAEAALSQDDRRALGASLADALSTALRAGEAGAAEAGGWEDALRSVDARAASGAPAAGGREIFAREGAPARAAALSRVDFGPELPCRRGGGGGRGAGALDGAAARVGRAAAPAIGLAASGSHLPLVVGAAPGAPLATALGGEDVAGIVHRRDANAAHSHLEDGVWPPVPRLFHFDFSWAVEVALGGFKGGEEALATRNAVVGQPIPRGATPAMLREKFAGLDPDVEAEAEGGGGGGVGGAAGDAPRHGGRRGARLALAEVPAVLPHGGALAAAAEPGPAAASAALDLLRAQRLATAEAALANAEEEESTGRAPRGPSAPRWDAYGYSAIPGYRGHDAYCLLHYRLLEAVEQRDLDAVWALWAEHCRMAPQDGHPDFLALEIVADACVRAKRTDLLYHALWPRMVELRMMPSPEFRFLLLKAAAMDGDAPRTVELLDALRAEGAPVDERHFSAAISACLAGGRWEPAFRYFNFMRSSGLPAGADLFAAFFKHLHAAGRAAECKSVWRALVGSPGLSVPPSLYAQAVEAFAEQGNVKDMEEAAARLGRLQEKAKDASAAAPDVHTHLAMFGAYTAAGMHEKAEDMIRCV